MPTLVADALLTPDSEMRPGRLAVSGADARVDGVLVPGFVDLQCNGARGTTLATGNLEDFERVGGALLRAGTTAWCPTLPSARVDAYPRFLDAAAAYQGGARSLGVHLEGPFLNPLRRGAHPPSALRDPDADWLETLLDGHPSLVRIVTLAPELPGALDVVKLCVARGVVVSLGHSDATADETLAAIDAGATMLTHLFNGMRPIHHRDPGVAAVCAADPRVYVGLICDGRHVDPMVASLFARAIGAHRVVVVSDAVASPSPGPVLSGGFALQDGALSNLLSWGFSLQDAVRMMTRTPADAIGAAGVGRLEDGGRGDAVLLRDGRVVDVWLGGEPVER